MISRLRLIVDQAVALREQVRDNIRSGQFDVDDVPMGTYNVLVGTAAGLIPDDQVLRGMIEMPDANLKARGLNMAPDLPSRRLEARLSEFINRLELIFGEPVTQMRSGDSARKVLADERSEDIRAVLDNIDTLLRSQPKRPSVETRDFDFISDPKLQQVLRLDFEEAQHAATAGAYKASSLLTGGLIEGMLMDRLQQPETVSRPDYGDAVDRLPRVKDEINWDRASLTQLVKVARKLDLLTEGALRLAEAAIDFRDTVHPNAELREGIRAKREEAQLLLGLVELIYRDLAN